MNLSTNYLGIPLKNPLIASASSVTIEIDNIRNLEDSGAAAVVLPSIFEEQIEQEVFAANRLAGAGAESAYAPGMQPVFAMQAVFSVLSARHKRSGAPTSWFTLSQLRGPQGRYFGLPTRPVWVMSAVFECQRRVGLPPTLERSPQRSEPTLRAKSNRSPTSSARTGRIRSVRAALFRREDQNTLSRQRDPCVRILWSSRGPR